MSKGETDKGKSQKGAKMNGMTDKQFEAFIKLILEILDSSRGIEEAKEKIKALLEK